MKKLLAESLHEYVNTIKNRNYVSTTTDDYKYEQSIEDDSNIEDNIDDDQTDYVEPKTKETSAERQLIDAPIGSKASGGGYDGWEKISNNSWHNSKINKLLNSYALAAHIGVFNDFVIIQPEVVKSKNDPRINSNSSTHQVLQLINDNSSPKGTGINTKEILNSIDYHWKTVTDAIERLHRLHYISRHLLTNPVTNRENYYYFITINGKKALAKIK